MKTIEYPIKEMVSVEMDKNGIWRVEYNERHELFRNSMYRKTKSGKWLRNVKGKLDFLESVYNFVDDLGFELEGNCHMVLGDHTIIPWSNSDCIGGYHPTILTPKVLQGYIHGCLYWLGIPEPYYGNQPYKKYIDDNNGECLLPFPKDVKWWE